MINKWSSEAVQTLQSLERYFILKAIEQGKSATQRAIELLSGKEEVTKNDVTEIVSKVIEEMREKKLY